MVDGPVLVTVVPANTAKEAAVPRPTAGWAAEAVSAPMTPLRITVVPTTPSTAANRRRLRISLRADEYWKQSPGPGMLFSSSDVTRS